MVRRASRIFLIGVALLTIAAGAVAAGAVAAGAVAAGAVAAGAVAAAPALRTSVPIPAIVDFSADTQALNYADVEAGTARVTLSWHTINASDQTHLALEAFYQTYWVSLLDTGETLPASGSKTVSVTLPQNFGVPTFRLTLAASANQVIDQQFLMIPYAPSAQAAPQIVSFTTPAQGVDTNLLIQGNSHIVVHWQIANRQPDTLIRFDQVFADGSSASAELPRRVLWVASSGDGIVVPKSTAAKDDLHFRLSLVSLHDGTVYDQADITVPVIGNVVMAAGSQTTVQAQGAPVLTASQPNLSGGQISTFSAESTTVEPGGTVTLSWDASEAASVNLLADNGDSGPTTLYIQLPPSGSITVPVPDDASGVTYTLRAESADGSVSTGEVNIAPSGDQSGDQGSGG